MAGKPSVSQKLVHWGPNMSSFGGRVEICQKIVFRKPGSAADIAANMELVMKTSKEGTAFSKKGRWR